MGKRVRPKLWFTFQGPGDETWKVFFVTRKNHPEILKQDGQYAWGLTFFGGPRKNKIYIDASRPAGSIFETLIHELNHVAYRHLGLSRAIDEAIVEDVSEILASILNQTDATMPRI